VRPSEAGSGIVTAEVVLYHPALRPTLSGSRAIPQGGEVRFSDGDAATPPIRRAGGSDERSC
jgi:hypothetical protein